MGDGYIDPMMNYDGTYIDPSINEMYIEPAYPGSAYPGTAYPGTAYPDPYYPGDM
jgi:hypothetical protein